jgi:hypothetical protein
MSMVMNMNFRKIQAALLASMLVIYFLWPGRVPLINTSLHGALLAVAMVIYLLTERRLDGRLALVYAPFVGAAAIAAALAPAPPGRDVLRPVVFGLISSYLFAYYASRTAVFDHVRQWLVPVVCAFTVCLALLPFVAQLQSLDGAAGWLLSGMVERGLFFILTAVFLFFVSLRSGLTLLSVIPLLIAVFMAVMLTSLRGIWLATAIAIAIFALLHRRVAQSVVVAAAFAVAVIFSQNLPEPETVVDSTLAAQTAVPATPADPPPPAATDPSPPPAVADPAPPPAAADPAPPPAADATETLRVRLSDLAVKSADRNKRTIDTSNAGRLGYWRAGISMWRDHPWVGVGLGRFPDRSEEYAVTTTEVGDAEKSFDAHNTFVSLLAETGIVGFAGFLVMLGAIFCKSALAWWRASGDFRLRHSVVLALFLGLTAVGLTWDVHVYRLWWVSLGLALGLSQIEWRQSS